MRRAIRIALKIFPSGVEFIAKALDFWPASFTFDDGARRDYYACQKSSTLAGKKLTVPKV